MERRGTFDVDQNLSVNEQGSTKGARNEELTFRSHKHSKAKE